MMSKNRKSPTRRLERPAGCPQTREFRMGGVQTWRFAAQRAGLSAKNQILTTGAQRSRR